MAAGAHTHPALIELDWCVVVCRAASVRGSWLEDWRARHT